MKKTPLSIRRNLQQQSKALIITMFWSLEKIYTLFHIVWGRFMGSTVPVNTMTHGECIISCIISIRIIKHFPLYRKKSLQRTLTPDMIFLSCRGWTKDFLWKCQRKIKYLPFFSANGKRKLMCDRRWGCGRTWNGSAVQVCAAKERYLSVFSRILWMADLTVWTDPWKRC